MSRMHARLVLSQDLLRAGDLLLALLAINSL